MSLEHILIKRREYLGKWESLVNITDTASGRIYHEMFTTRDYPTVEILTPLVIRAKARIQQQIDLAANDFNTTSDEEQLLGHYRNIKRDIILQVREYPAATLQQASDYIADKYPDSVFDFARLYAIWLEIAHCENWEEFKAFCIDHKFEGVD